MDPSPESLHALEDELEGFSRQISTVQDQIINALERGVKTADDKSHLTYLEGRVDELSKQRHEIKTSIAFLRDRVVEREKKTATEVDGRPTSIMFRCQVNVDYRRPVKEGCDKLIVEDDEASKQEAERIQAEEQGDRRLKAEDFAVLAQGWSRNNTALGISGDLVYIPGSSASPAWLFGHYVGGFYAVGRMVKKRIGSDSRIVNFKVFRTTELPYGSLRGRTAEANLGVPSAIAGLRFRVFKDHDIMRNVSMALTQVLPYVPNLQQLSTSSAVVITVARYSNAVLQEPVACTPDHDDSMVRIQKDLEHVLRQRGFVSTLAGLPHGHSMSVNMIVLPAEGNGVVTAVLPNFSLAQEEPVATVANPTAIYDAQQDRSCSFAAVVDALFHLVLRSASNGRTDRYMVAADYGPVDLSMVKSVGAVGQPVTYCRRVVQRATRVMRKPLLFSERFTTTALQHNPILNGSYAYLVPGKPRQEPVLTAAGEFVVVGSAVKDSFSTHRALASIVYRYRSDRAGSAGAQQPVVGGGGNARSLMALREQPPSVDVDHDDPFAVLPSGKKGFDPMAAVAALEEEHRRAKNREEAENSQTTLTKTQKARQTVVAQQQRRLQAARKRAELDQVRKKSGGDGLSPGVPTPDEIAAIFRRMDDNGNGFLSRKEAVAFFNSEDWQEGGFEATAAACREQEEEQGQEEGEAGGAPKKQSGTGDFNVSLQSLLSTETIIQNFIEEMENTRPSKLYSDDIQVKSSTPTFGTASQRGSLISPSSAQLNNVASFPPGASALAQAPADDEGDVQGSGITLEQFTVLFYRLCAM